MTSFKRGWEVKVLAKSCAQLKPRGREGGGSICKEREQ